MARVVVIGAGIGGMAAAARLRVKGHQVTVVEAAETHGGQLGTVKKDGFHFDTGPTTLTLPAVYRDLFLKTGAPLEDSVELVPLDPGAQYRFADGTTLAMPGVGAGRAAAATGEALGGRAADDWRDLLQRGGQIWAATRRPILESPVGGIRDLLPLTRDRAALRAIAPWHSLRGLGRAALNDPRARQVLEGYAGQVGSDPRHAPAAMATIPYVESTFGVWHVAGGLHRLADALFARMQERGVTVRLATPATRIQLAGGGVSGVELVGGEVLPADVVVANADAALVYSSLLGDHAPRAQRRATQRATRSASAFSLLLAVRGRTPGMAHHTVWLPPPGDRELDAVFGSTPRPASDPTIHACIPDDPEMRPDDSEAWSIQVSAPRQSPDGHATGTIDWDAPGLADTYADQVLSRLAERGTDVRDRILWREIRTPADVERTTRAPGGALHGAAVHGLRGTWTRPANITPISGLFLVGSSTHPGPGLPQVGLSAEIVANLVGRA